MTKGILGRKIGMTQLFADNGEVVPVTVIQAEPNIVLQKKTLENDGYEAVQFGFSDERESRINQAKKGHAEKASTTPKRYVREFRNVKLDEYEVGQEVNVDVFQAGDKIDVTGTSKGKGYAGTIKRFNYSRGLMSHGSRFHRAPGSLGSIDAMRVFKGTPLPGQMGSEQVTIQNLEVFRVDAEENLIIVKGSVPGAKKGLIKIASAIKE